MGLMLMDRDIELAWAAVAGTNDVNHPFFRELAAIPFQNVRGIFDLLVYSYQSRILISTRGVDMKLFWAVNLI